MKKVRCKRYVRIGGKQGKRYPRGSEIEIEDTLFEKWGEEVFDLLSEEALEPEAPKKTRKKSGDN